MEPSTPNSARSPLSEPTTTEPQAASQEALSSPPNHTSAPTTTSTQSLPRVQKGVPWPLAVVGLALLACITFIGVTTQDYETAKLLGTVMFWVGLAVATTCGFCLARLVSNSITVRNSGGPASGKSSLFTVGIILCASSVILGILTLIPGVILIIMGSRPGANAAPGVPPRSPINNGGKIALVALSFLGGFIPAAFLALVLTFMVSQHACELSSSKCY